MSGRERPEEQSSSDAWHGGIPLGLTKVSSRATIGRFVEFVSEKQNIEVRVKRKRASRPFFSVW